MSSAPRYIPHYTFEDYRHWKGEWELWFGTAVATGPSPFAPHERCVSRIARSFGNQIDSLGCTCEVYTNLDWIVANDVIVRPDVMVVCGEQPEQHLQRSPSVAVEVISPATVTKDREHKMALYERQQVRHYLIADPTNRSIDYFAFVDGCYQQVESGPELFLPDGDYTFRLLKDEMFA